MINMMEEYGTIKRLKVRNKIHASNRKAPFALKPRKKHKEQ